VVHIDACTESTATFVQDVAQALDAYNPTPIDGSVNLWLMTFLTGGKTMWVHIVGTEEAAAEKIGQTRRADGVSYKGFNPGSGALWG
jgi:hypothetical protein